MKHSQHKLCFTVLIVCLGFTACKKTVDPRTELVFGTVCTVNAYEDGTEKLYGELFSCLNRLDAEFSTTRADSEVSKINDAAGSNAIQVSQDVLYITGVSLAYASLTGGAFDPTIGPVVKLWGINTDHARVPSQKELNDALPLVNWHNVTLSGTSVFLQKKGMRLDFGGIVKGFAADKLVDILRTHKVKRAVIDLGGNIYVYGKKKDNTLWRVGIKNPDDPSGLPAVVLALQNSTVVTSGVYERFFIQDGIRYHHIINPKTGYPVDNGLTSVSIISESSTAADALSTSLFILGPDKGFALLKSFAAQAAEAGNSGKKKQDEIINDGMGTWLFTGIPSPQNEEPALTPAGTPSLSSVPGIPSAVSAVFISDKEKVLASEELKSVLEIKNSSFAPAEFR